MDNSNVWSAIFVLLALIFVGAGIERTRMNELEKRIEVLESQLKEVKWLN